MNKRSMSAVTDNLVLSQKVCQHAKDQPQKTALIQIKANSHDLVIEKEMTYLALYEAAQKLAQYFVSHQYQGKCAVLIYNNNIDYLISFLACLYAGVIAVPVNKPAKSMHLRRFLNVLSNTDSDLILTGAHEHPSLYALFEREQLKKNFSWVVTDQIIQENHHQHHVPLGNDVRIDDIAMLQYTSGSTGHPKGAVITNENLAYNQLMLQKAFSSNQDSTFVTWVPFHHDLGLILHVIHALYVGATNVIMTPMTFVQNPFIWLKAISTFKADISGAPNFAYKLCVEKITSEQKIHLDLSHWRAAVNAAEPVNHHTLNIFYDAFRDTGFKKTYFLPLYGLAEATVFVAARKTPLPLKSIFVNQVKISEGIVEQTDSSHHGVPYVSCGGPWLDEEIAIVDPYSAKRCAPNEVGEIWIRGPHIANGYWKNVEESNKTFYNRITAENDGGLPYLRTKDLGFLVDHELYICGRMNDTIIIRGTNYYPQDIEYSVECVDNRLVPSAIAVFSIEEDAQEHLIVVAEVSRHCLKEQPDQLKHIFQTLKEKINETIIDTFGISVKDIVFIKQASLSRTSSGKIQRSACKQTYLNGALNLAKSWREKSYEKDYYVI